MAQPSEVRDPVCGMIVDTKSPYRSIFQGETFYFCSENCRQPFEANPAHYAARSHGAADRKPAERPLERHEPPFTKDRDGLVSPKFGSAGSGGAEYELLPEAHDDDETR